MYQSNSFFINEQSECKIFRPAVKSAFKILADRNYHHQCNDDEKLHYSDKTIAFIRCTQGSGEILLNEKRIKINENECVFIKFHDIKEYKSTSHIWGYNWVNFIAKHMETEFEINKIYKIPCSENESKAFNKLLTYARQHLENRSYISSLFTDYFYCVMLESQLNLKEEVHTRLIDEICEYIHQKLYSKISIEELALFFKITPRRLHQIFTKELHISPKQYIKKKKMEEGYRLLVQTSTPINKIAYMLCFSSPYHFTNEFKKTFSQTPSEVRKIEK